LAAARRHFLRKATRGLPLMPFLVASAEQAIEAAERALETFTFFAGFALAAATVVDGFAGAFLASETLAPMASVAISMVFRRVISFILFRAVEHLSDRGRCLLLRCRSIRVGVFAIVLVEPSTSEHERVGRNQFIWIRVCADVEFAFSFAKVCCFRAWLQSHFMLLPTFDNAKLVLSLIEIFDLCRFDSYGKHNEK
jgi:hypothetical protein